MNIDDYRETVSDIKASESLKRRIINTLKSKEETKRQKFSKQVVLAVAACLTVAVLIPVLVLTVIVPGVNPARKNLTPTENSAQNGSLNSSVTEETLSSESEPDLPKLTIAADNGRSGGGKYFGCRAEDIDISNPWTEDMDIKKFPVYKCTENLSAEEMTAIGKKVAEKLGIKEYSCTFHPTEEGIDFLRPEHVTITSEIAEITTISSGTTSVYFNTVIKLPEEFDFYNFDKTIAQKDAIADYLVEHYNVRDIRSPLIKIENMTDSVAIYMYNNDVDNAEKILEYFCTPVIYMINTQGMLRNILINDYRLNEKIGDYPIISLTEAKELLLENHYISNYDDVPNQNNIYTVQFCIIPLNDEQLPYYVFYIETPSLETDGNKVYGTYYVPAIESEYLTNFPGDGPLEFQWY